MKVEIKSVTSPIQRSIIDIATNALGLNHVFPESKYAAVTLENPEEWGGYFCHSDGTLVARTPAGNSGEKLALIRCPYLNQKERTRIYYKLDDKYDSTVYIDVVAMTREDNGDEFSTCFTYAVRKQ